MATVPTQDVIAPCIGARFVFEHQGLWSIKPENHGSFGINQAMQRIENMGLGRHAIFKSHMWTALSCKGENSGVTVSFAPICPACCCSVQTAGQDGFCDGSSIQFSGF